MVPVGSSLSPFCGGLGCPGIEPGSWCGLVCSWFPGRGGGRCAFECLFTSAQCVWALGLLLGKHLSPAGQTVSSALSCDPGVLVCSSGPQAACPHPQSEVGTSDIWEPAVREGDALCCPGRRGHRQSASSPPLFPLPPPDSRGSLWKAGCSRFCGLHVHLKTEPPIWCIKAL